MPRIDPLKLLSCLGVLLAPNGGIRSSAEVARLASLMARYSKKLVSKCIYVHILKCTDTELLNQFMTTGGWQLSHLWLQDGMVSLNWPFVQELLEMLLLCPVDANRLKTNTAPKLVKNLSHSCPHNGVRVLATKLVEQWLKIARQENSEPTVVNNNNQRSTQQYPITPQNIENQTNGFGHQQMDSVSIKQNFDTSVLINNNNISDNNLDNIDIKEDNNSMSDNCIDNILNDSNSSAKQESLVFKISKKNGKQVIENINKTSPEAITKSNSEIDGKIEKSDSDSKVDENKKERVRKDSSSDSSRDKSKKNEKSSDKSEKSKDSSTDKEKEKERDRDRDKSRKSSSSHKSSSSSKTSSSSSSHRTSSSSSSHKSSKSSHSSSKSSSSSSRDKDRDKDKHRSSSSRHSSSSSKSSSSDKKRDDKEKEKQSQTEKDKDTLSKLFSPQPTKLAKIPKKVSDSGSDNNKSKDTDKDKQDKNKEIVKKPTSISIEVRKGDKPKTVKTLNSQFRNHGLAEEAPPPPSRKGLKKPLATTASSATTTTTTNTVAATSSTVSTTTSSSSLKRASPTPLSSKEAPPEKKKKEALIDEPIQDRVGGIKLIKPKPLLIESDMFMDALSASAHKNLKKRKRLSSQSNAPTTPTELKSKEDAESSKMSDAKPMQFYKDTLEDSEEKKENRNDNGDTSDNSSKNNDSTMDVDNEKSKSSENSNEAIDNKVVEEEEPPVKKPPGIGTGPDGPPGVLMIHRRKGPKKQLKWKPQEELEDIRYFELDETERANVTKTSFMEQKKMERFDERQAIVLGRKMSSDDVMVEQVPWRPLMIVDNVPVYAYGSKSREKKIQSEREQTVLQSLFFTSVPDTPAEADQECYEYSEPVVVPLDDLSGNPDGVNDFSNIPWPEPKPDNTGLMNAFPNVFPTATTPNILGQAFGNAPPNLGLPAASPFVNPAIWNINPMTALNGFGAMGNLPRMPELNLMNGPASIPTLLTDMTAFPPFGPPAAINNIRMNNNGNRPNNNLRMPDRDRNDRNFNNYNSHDNGNDNWRDRNGSNGGGGGGGNRNWIHNNHRNVCRQYEQKGFCRNGDNCKYYHARN